MKKEILNNDKKYIWHPFTNIKKSDPPIIISSAHGDRLIDIDGKNYIDLISSWWVNIHGHGKKEIIDEITKQANELDQVVFAGLTHNPAVKLAKKLSDLLPDGLNRVFYSDNGSTAVEIALKVSYQYWKNKNKKKSKFISFSGGYHGDTLGAMSVGFSSGFYEPFKDLVFKSQFIPFPENWKGNNAVEEQENKSLIFADNLIEKHGSELVAVIIEPLVQGAAGMRMCRPHYINQIVKKFQSNDILVIFDEVMTGFGRTGKMFSTDHLEVKPDIICLAKAITGGYLPLAATVFSEKIHDEFVNENLRKSFLHGHSFSANPIACSAANISLELFNKEKTLLKVKKIEEYHTEGINMLINNQLISKTRVLGGIAAFDVLGVDKKYGAEFGERFKKRLLHKGYIVRPLGQTIYLMPPFCTEKETLHKAYKEIDLALKSIKF